MAPGPVAEASRRCPGARSSGGAGRRAVPGRAAPPCCLRERGGGSLQRPGWVVDLEAQAHAAQARIQAVALDQELVQAPGRGGEDGTRGRVRAAENGRAAAPARLVVDGAGLVGADGHRRMPVGQAEEGASPQDRGEVGGIEAEEVDTGAAAEGHVGAHVHLRESGQSRKGGQTPRADHRQVERDHAQPGPAVVQVQVEEARNPGAERVDGDRPVREEQVCPGLGHHPWGRGTRPGPA